MSKTLNKLRDEAYQNSVEHGFHDSDRQVSETKVGRHALIAQRLALIHSEISEALEADRKERGANLEAFDSSADSFSVKFKAHIKDSFEDELADAMIRIFDLCGWMDIDIQRHVELKMQYNSCRERMHGKTY